LYKPAAGRNASGVRRPAFGDAIETRRTVDGGPRYSASLAESDSKVLAVGRDIFV
jgi:hypothetical protein